MEQKLAPELLTLFWRLSVPDQCHALRTARHALRLAENASGTVDLPLLTRCALLHDVGRKKGDLGTFWKSFAVLFSAFFPETARTYGDDLGDGILARKMRVYFHHAEIGAELLFRIGFLEEAKIIRKHHEAPTEDDPLELRLLRMADEMS